MKFAEGKEGNGGAGSAVGSDPLQEFVKELSACLWRDGFLAARCARPFRFRGWSRIDPELEISGISAVCDQYRQGRHRQESAEPFEPGDGRQIAKHFVPRRVESWPMTRYASVLNGTCQIVVNLCLTARLGPAGRSRLSAACAYRHDAGAQSLRRARVRFVVQRQRIGRAGIEDGSAKCDRHLALNVRLATIDEDGHYSFAASDEATRGGFRLHAMAHLFRRNCYAFVGTATPFDCQRVAP